MHSLVLASAILGLVAIPLAAQENTEELSPPATASVEALAHAGETCSVGKRQERKMLEHIEESGFEAYVAADLETREGSYGRRDPAGIAIFRREGVQLSYFHSRMMRSCNAEGVVDEKFELDALLANLTQRLGKDPKVDTPGQKYLFNVSGAILTVQIKQADGETTVSLGTVRT